VNAPSVQRANGREIALFGAALAALWTLLLFLADGSVLFSRPYWVDEWLTVLASSHASPLRVIGDLRAGVDGGSGLLHLVVWLLHFAAPSLPPVLLRALSFLTVFSALCLLYVVLRRRFSSDASAAGVFAVMANQLIVAHAFEARFYGPWLLTCVLFAWTLARRQEGAADRRSGIWMAVAAVLMCTAHFYGIITLCVMGAAAALTFAPDWRRGLRFVAPAAAGFVATAAVVPLAMGQKRAYTVATWLSDFSWPQLAGLGREFWLARVAVLGAIALVTAAALTWQTDRARPVRTSLETAFRDPAIASLLALATVPIALAVVSLLGQPSMLARYAVTTALFWGPWVALALQQHRRWVVGVARLFLLWVAFTSITKEVRDKRAFASSVAQARSAYRQVAGSGVPVVFQSIHVMYPVVGDERATTPARFLAVTDSAFGVLLPTQALRDANRGIVIERDLARVHARRLLFPKLVEPASLDSIPRFLLLAPEGRLPAGYPTIGAWARVAFPDHRLRRITADLSLLERIASAP